MNTFVRCHLTQSQWFRWTDNFPSTTLPSSVNYVIMYAIQLIGKSHLSSLLMFSLYFYTCEVLVWFLDKWSATDFRVPGTISISIRIHFISPLNNDIKRCTHLMTAFSEQIVSLQPTIARGSLNTTESLVNRKLKDEALEAAQPFLIADKTLTLRGETSLKIYVRDFSESICLCN